MRRSRLALGIAAVGVALGWGIATLRPQPDRVPAGEATPTLTPPTLAGGASVATAATTPAAVVGTVRRDGAPRRAHVVLRRVRNDVVPTAELGPDPAELRPLPQGTREVSRGAADDDGRFAFQVEGPGLFVVEAEDDAGGRGRAIAVVTTAHGAEVSVTLRAAGALLTGRAVYADGRPFDGTLLVRALEDGTPSELLSLPWGDAVGLDAGGAFAASGLAAGAVQLVAFAPGRWVSMSEPIALPRAELYAFVVDAAAPSVTGTVEVEASGTPVAGALVLSTSPLAGPPLHARTTTDAQGRFRAPRPIRAGRLIVTAAGFDPAYVASALVREGMTIRLSPAARLEGRVHTADGKPVPGVRVAVRTLSGRRVGEAAPDTATTGADGRFAIDPAATGEVEARVEDDAWALAGHAATRAGAEPPTTTIVSGKTATVDLEVEQAARAIVRALDPTGRPIAAARVEAELLSGGAAGIPWQVERRVGASAETDEEGRATIEGLVPGLPHRLQVEALGWPESRSAPFVAGGNTVPTLEVRLVAGRTIDVRVEDDEGRPLGGVQVLAALRSAPARRGPRRDVFVTDASGHAHVGPCPEGSVQIAAAVSGFATASTAVDANATQATLVLDRSGTISGTVMGPDGIPADGASVQVRGPFGAPIDRATTSRADGSFSLDGLPPGSHTLEAMSIREGRWLRVQTVASVGATDVRLVLAPSEAAARGGFRLRVLGADGTPVPKAMGVVRRGRGGLGGFNVEEGVAFPNMDDTDTATIVVWGARTMADVPLPWGATSRTLSTLPRDGVEVRMEPERAVEGVVVDPSGRGVAGATLAVIPAGWESIARMNRSQGLAIAHTDREGRFRLAGLGDEEYPLLVWPPPGYPMPRDRTVRGGETGLRIELGASSVVRVTVIDEAGTPVPFASITVAREAEGTAPGDVDTRTRTTRAVLLQCWTASDGTAQLFGLDPDVPVRLVVGPTEHATFMPLTMGSWRPRDVTVRVAPGGLVRGMVVDPAGLPLEGIHVHLQGEASKYMTVETDARGQFEFLALPGVPHEVWATAEAYSGAPSGKLRVTPNASEVRLVLAGVRALAVKIRDVPRDLIGETAELAAEGDGRGSSATRRARIGSDGTARFVAVRTDLAYTLWIPPSADGRVLLQRGVRGEGQDLAVALVAGRSVSGRLRVAPGFRQPMVQLQVEWFDPVEGKVDADGRFHIEGVPEGRWRLSYSAFRDGSGEWYSVEVEAGATVDLEVPPPGK